MGNHREDYSGRCQKIILEEMSAEPFFLLILASDPTLKNVYKG